MGPLAMPKSALPGDLTLTTRVNGELRQSGNIQELIFSVPTLISTLSASQTLRPGDVIATGTPFGVGFGLKPPVFLKPGDVIEISVSGLGTLRNQVVEATTDNHVQKRVSSETNISTNNLAITHGGVGLTCLPNGKKLYAKTLGSGSQSIIFIHGLGGTHTFYEPFLSSLALDVSDPSRYTALLYDLEGHGLSPTKATSTLSIETYATDLHALIHALSLPNSHNLTLIAHDMGCLVATLFASYHPSSVVNLVLLGPVPCPLPLPEADALLTRAALVRVDGMRNVALDVATATTSPHTRSRRTVAHAAVQLSLLSQDPEGYAKGCVAMAGARDALSHYNRADQQPLMRTLLLTGSHDLVATSADVRRLAGTMGDRVTVVLLEDVGHWHIYEDAEGVAKAIGEFLGMRD